MIRLDRDDSLPLHEQLSKQIRYRIATGQYGVGDLLPSTRALAKQLQISFQTVRKAYEALSEDGLANPVQGRGYVVTGLPPSSKAERLEAGAATLQLALQHLLAHGLTDDEIDYLFDEQRSAMAAEQQRPAAVFAAEFAEMADSCSEQLAPLLPVDLEGATLAELDQYRDVEIALCPFPLVRRVLELLPRADVIGVHTFLGPSASAVAARLFDYETLLLVSRYSDAIAPLTRMLRSGTGFSGQLLAMAADEGTTGLDGLVRQSDALLYLPGTARRVRPLLASAAIHQRLDFSIPEGEPARVRELLPL